MELESQVEIGRQLDLQLVGWEECELEQVVLLPLGCVFHNDEKQTENQTWR